MHHILVLEKKLPRQQGRKRNHFVGTCNVLTILLGNDLNLDLWPWPCCKSRSPLWATFDPNIYLINGLTYDLIIGVCINDICVLVPYQGQGQRSTSRSLHSKIVKTFLVLTFRFHDLRGSVIIMTYCSLVGSVFTVGQKWSTFLKTIVKTMSMVGQGFAHLLGKLSCILSNLPGK